MDELTIPATLSPMNNIPSTSFGPNQPSIGAEQFGPSSDLATNVPPETPSDQARPLHLDVDSSSGLDFQTLAGQSPPSVENVIIDTEGSKAEWRQPTVTSKSDDDSDDAVRTRVTKQDVETTGDHGNHKEHSKELLC